MGDHRGDPTGTSSARDHKPPRGPYSPSLSMESRADHATPMCPKKMLWATNPWNPERDRAVTEENPESVTRVPVLQCADALNTAWQVDTSRMSLGKEVRQTVRPGPYAVHVHFHALHSRLANVFVSKGVNNTSSPMDMGRGNVPRALTVVHTPSYTIRRSILAQGGTKN